jgi:hypothetical protein
MTETDQEFLDRFPWECLTPYHYDQVVPWLEDNIGQFDQEWYRYGSDIAMGIVAGLNPHDIYRFRDEKSAVLFRLRWS